MTLAEKQFGPGFYQIYFQEPGVAEAELDRDAKDSIYRFFSAGQDESSLRSLVPVVARGKGILDALPIVGQRPAWLSEAELELASAPYAAGGFTGGLNWYRNLDRNWDLTAAWQNANITPPSLFVTGDRDISRELAGPGFFDRLPEVLTDLRGVVDLENCGHWIQQEHPDEVREALVTFLAGL